MAVATTNLTVRLDKALKREAEELFDGLGMSVSTAFMVFLKHAVRERGIPFKVTLKTETEKPNAVTLAAIREAKRISRDPKVKGYTEMADIIRELNA
jgi:DNA-damage-inducible protein J